MRDFQRVMVQLAVASLAVLFSACSSDGEGSAAPAAAVTDSAEDGGAEPSVQQDMAATITFTSPVFNEKRRIPAKHTCTNERPPPDGVTVAPGAAGENISPPLEWTDVPEGTTSIALIIDSEEAVGPWTHWVVWNIPADSTGLSEGVSTEAELPDGSRQGANSAGDIGYLGPCPPPFAIIDASAGGDVVRSKTGSVQKYYFHLYALDSVLDLAPGATKEDLLGAMEGHVLGTGELAGERVGRKILKHQ
jgi:phosphatidylethanolamine-binding protein (PEBP) family uncharacterized protein